MKFLLFIHWSIEYQWLFPGSKTTGAWSWPLISIQCRGKEFVELYLHSRIRLHGVMFSWSQGSYLPSTPRSSNWSLSFRFPDHGVVLS